MDKKKTLWGMGKLQTKHMVRNTRSLNTIWVGPITVDYGQFEVEQDRPNCIGLTSDAWHVPARPYPMSPRFDDAAIFFLYAAYHRPN